VRLALPDCEVFTAYQRGWSELKNGELLRAAEADRVEIFVTSDKNIRHQQNLIAALPSSCCRRTHYSFSCHCSRPSARL
jgi:hypothetical protein